MEPGGLMTVRDRPGAAVPWAIDLPDLEATSAFAARLAPQLRRGDVLLLEGELGAGKTELARALIRARAGASVEVPSPSFTLVQLYELPGLMLGHADLYRLRAADEVHELGLEEVWSRGCLVVEWPERASGLWPEERLRLTLQGPFPGQPQRRLLTLDPTPGWRARLAALCP
jgi:tRNA threonylcarbamoyl adenosine modification protein YjeE